MHTLWSLAQALAELQGQPGADALRVGGVLGVELKLVKENAHVRFYENESPLRLAGGVIAGKLDIREFKAAGKAPFIVISQLGGACIGMEELQRRIGALTPPTPPSNPVPDALITRQGRLGKVRVSLGFRWSDPDCLASITPHID